MADYWELVGSSPAGGAENLVNEESHIDVQLDQRHMMLRGETVRTGERRRGKGKDLGGGEAEDRGGRGETVRTGKRGKGEAEERLKREERNS